MLKVDLIADAYSLMRISGLTVNPTPEDLELALSRLEDMAAEWSLRIKSGYNLEDDPSPSSITNLPRPYKTAFSSNLAMRLLSDFGKQPNQSLMSTSASSLRSLSAATALVQDTVYPTRQPIGSGNSYRGWNRWQRFYWPSNTAPLSTDTNNIQIDEINDYTEHFDAYLDQSETIASFTISADDGLNLESSSNSDVDVYYRVKGQNGSGSSGFNQVYIEITTSGGRVEKREVNFNVTE